MKALLGSLTARPDSLGIVLDVGARWVHVEELSSVGRIESGEEQGDAERSGQGGPVRVRLSELDRKIGNGLKIKYFRK